MASSRAIRYRRSPHIVFYWSGRTLVLHNYATRTRLAGSPVVCEILDYLRDWRTAGQLFAFKPGVNPRLLRALLDKLVKTSYVQREDRAARDGDSAMAAWREWNPAAGFFHTSTKDLRYAGLRTIERVTRERARVTPMPPSVKRYRGAQRVALPPAQTGGEFPRVLLERRTWRRFASKPVDLASFSTLLHLTAGVQAWAIGPANQKVALKTSPSGGARQPIELYVAALNVRGLRKGLYHYAADRHALERLAGRVDVRDVQRYFPQQWWYKGAAAVIFFTAVFERVQWRYAHARAYRAVLIEAGHFCQTFCLTATWLGLAPFCSMALADGEIERDLGIDGIRESVMYAAGVGTRPRGIAWIPPAAHRGHPPTLEPEEELKVPGLIVSRRHRR